MFTTNGNIKISIYNNLEDNMKFSQYKYERSSYEDIKDKFIKLVDKINKSTNYEDQKNYILQLNEIRNDIQSNSTIASIRYSIDTSDEYYEEEKKYWDEYMPLYEDLNCEFYKAIVNSQFKNEIINDFSKQFYNICEDSIKSFSKEIIEDLQEENKLCSQYTKLLASATFSGSASSPVNAASADESDCTTTTFPAKSDNELMLESDFTITTCELSIYGVVHV